MSSPLVVPESLTIVADENIPLLNEFFSGFGEIITCPGRTMTPREVARADILLVRSVTQVNQALLADSPVRFVATATSGTDHVDKEWLNRHNIAFASAAGCNAAAVVDYVLAALDTLREEQGFCLEQRTVGIVGYGQVGSRLYERMSRLGVPCVVCDPFREVPHGVDIDELVAQADIISVHTPLTHEGTHPTWHLLNQERLARLQPGTVLINAGRGAVVDNAALLALLQTRADLAVVLDVWEDEPALSTELLNLAAIGTPHIAGYSVDGKVLGTAMVYQSLCEFLGVTASVHYQNVAPQPLLQVLDMTGEQAAQATAAAVRLVYDIRRDDWRLRQLARRCQGDTQGLVRGFDQLRRSYPQRREFSTLRLRVPEVLKPELSGFGFQIERRRS